MKTRVTLFLLFIVFLAGCDKQIIDYIGQHHRDNSPVIENPSFTATKISPGTVLAIGSQVQGQFVLKPTEQKEHGTQVDAVVPLNQKSH